MRRQADQLGKHSSLKELIKRKSRRMEGRKEEENEERKGGN